MKNYEIGIIQEIYEELCYEFLKYDVIIEVDKNQYQLLFLTEDVFRKKYVERKTLEEVGIV